MCASPSLRGGAAYLQAQALAGGQAALAAAGQNWAQLSITPGGVLQVSGPAPDDAARAAALNAVQTALANQVGMPGVLSAIASTVQGPVIMVAAEPPKTAPATPAVTTPTATAPTVTTPAFAAPANAAGVDVGDGGVRACGRAINAELRAHPIRFAAGSAAVAGVGRQNFTKLAAIAAACDRHRLRIAGHTDARGGAAFNQRLSQQRAAAVQALLVEAGVAPAALSAIGFGETRPLDRARTQVAFARNRRIEIAVSAR